jgi:hypothetical protein
VHSGKPVLWQNVCGGTSSRSGWDAVVEVAQGVADILIDQVGVDRDGGR